MKRQITLLALLAALLLPAVGASAQEEMTVANGTTTNSNLPVWGLWLDNNTHTQSIYPASMLDELVGSNIQQLTGGAFSLEDLESGAVTPAVQIPGGYRRDPQAGAAFTLPAHSYRAFRYE